MPTTVRRLSRIAAIHPAPSLAAAVRTVQIAYPRIYLACHTAHTRARSTPFRLSARDSSLLVHLDETEPTRPADLARHMDIGAPTLSAALRRLEALGYLRRTPSGADRRRLELRLTRTGAVALSATSVLEPARVRALLRSLAPEDRSRAVAGLAILGRAAAGLGRRGRA